MKSPVSIYVAPDIAAVRQLYANLFDDEFRQLSIRDQIDGQAEQLLIAFKAGNPVTAVHLTCWHPQWIGHPATQIMAARLGHDDARQALAREYGFADWNDVQKKGQDPPNATFEATVDALLSGDTDELSSRLNLTPSLATQRSDFGHRSTLLHYAGSNGVETHRQVVPANLCQSVNLLLSAGAKVDAPANIYGGGTTTLALVTSSAHPREAGIAETLIKVLLDAGAETDPDEN